MILVNASVILAFSSSLVLHEVLLTSCSTEFHTQLIKGSQSEYLGSQVLGMIRSQTFSYSQHWLLLVASLSCYSLDSNQHYLLKALDVNFYVGCEAMCKNEQRCNFCIACDQAKLYGVGWVFAFHQYRYILWGQSEPTVVLWVHNLVLAEIFLIWEKPKHVRLEGSAWVCSKALLSSLPSCP